MTHATSGNRVTIPCLRIDIRQGNDERDMRAVGAKLGYHVDEHLLELDPAAEWPLTTIVHALQDKPGAALIVPDLEHLAGIDSAVRLLAAVITVKGERILERAHTAEGAA